MIAISGASACQQNVPTDQLTQTPLQTTPQKKLTPVIVTQPQAILPTKLHQIKHQGIQFNIVTFDTRNQQLIVADQPKGPGSTWADAEAAAKANNGIAAINAGFFTPEGSPLGIVISNGSKRGSNNPSSLGTGIFYHTPTGASISRRAIWTKLSQSPPSHLLQSGPMLLENSNPVAGLSDKSSRVRSFIATDGKKHWCIGHAESCTLAQLSKALTSLETPQFNPTTALNLDGGRSSDLWVASSVAGGDKTIRPFWNKPVLNFLILKSN
ncbi:MAG: phosphodiester glycosidase family protein [Akkermansiaceae bacterium]